MGLEKFRQRIFATVGLVAPYGTTVPTLSQNGELRITHVGNSGSLLIRSGGTTYRLNLSGTVVGGII